MDRRMGPDHGRERPHLHPRPLLLLPRPTRPHPRPDRRSDEGVINSRVGVGRQIVGAHSRAPCRFIATRPGRQPGARLCAPTRSASNGAQFVNRDDLTRRALVRRSLAIAAGGALAANLATTARSVAQEASPEAGPMIALDLLGGDVWAWEKRLTGT